MTGTFEACGAAFDQSRRLLVGSTGFGGEVVALDADSLEVRWRTTVGYCGGFIEVDREAGITYATLQCGNGDDPWVALETGTGRLLAKRGTRSVAGTIHVDPPRKRAWISAGGRLLRVADLEVDLELDALHALAVDLRRGRLLARGDDGLLHVVAEWTSRPLDMAPATAAVHDVAADRLWLLRGDRVVVHEGESLERLRDVELGAPGQSLVLDTTRRCLWVLVAGPELVRIQLD